jgi:hypothetical protein
MSDELVRRVDALVRRQEPSGAKEVPVLTDIVAGEERGPRRPVDDAALEALARALNPALVQGVEGVRAEIKVSVHQMVREAVAASVAFALRPKTPE